MKEREIKEERKREVKGMNEERNDIYEGMQKNEMGGKLKTKREN